MLKRAVVRERDVMMLKKELAKPGTLQELKVEMTAGNTYATMFPNIFKLWTFCRHCLLEQLQWNVLSVR